MKDDSRFVTKIRFKLEKFIEKPKKETIPFEIIEGGSDVPLTITKRGKNATN